MATFNLTIPVHNEESILENKLEQLLEFLQTKDYSNDIFLVLSDNASVDSTTRLCEDIIQRESPVKILNHHSPIKGKGNAIRESWQKYEAAYYMFMDIDLSVDLKHLDEMVNLLPHHDLVIGSRLAKESVVRRSLVRELTSRGYNSWLKILFNKKFSDTQCGFKGVNKKVVDYIISSTKSNGYFFDSELLILAERLKYDIKEIPVICAENPCSKVKLYETIPYFILKSLEFYFCH